MSAYPKRFAERVQANLKKYQALARSCRDRDINESDTVTLIMDILSEVLGFDKFGEITKEFQVRSTYCDLAIRCDAKLRFLIECKAIGIELRDTHTQQAVGYAAAQGCEWVILTNGAIWKVYHITFAQPVAQELVYEFDLLTLNPRAEGTLDMLFALSREGIEKKAIDDFREAMQAKDKFCVAAILVQEPVLRVIRRELRSLNDGVMVDLEELAGVIRDQCLKREVVEGDKAEEAQKKIRRFMSRRAREKSSASEDKPGEESDDKKPATGS